MSEDEWQPPETPPLALPLRVDFEASRVMGCGMVLDKTGRVVAECPDLDLAAKVNGNPPEDEWRRMKMLTPIRKKRPVKARVR